MALERWTDERLDRFAATVEAAFTAVSRDIAQLVMTQQQQYQQLVTTQQQQYQQQQQQYQQLLDAQQVTNAQVQASLTGIDELAESVRELRAGQEHQARLLDYLLRKEAERQQDP